MSESKSCNKSRPKGLMDLPVQVLQPILRMVLNETNWIRFYVLRDLCHFLRDNVDFILKQAKTFEIDAEIGYVRKRRFMPLDQYLDRLIEKSPDVETVTIKSYELNMVTLMRALSKVPKVKVLNLIDCKISGPFFMKASKFDNIVELNLSGTKVPYREMKGLFELIPNMQSLIYFKPISLRNFLVDNVWSLYGSAEHWKEFSIDLFDFQHIGLFMERFPLKMNQKLEVLDMNMGPLKLEYLLRLTSLRKLKSLRMKFMTDSDTVINFPPFNCLKRLELIELSKVNYSYINDYFLENALRVNRHVRSLYLEVNNWSSARIASSVTERFYKYLVDLTSVEELELKNINNLTVRSIRILSKSNTIKQLTLFNVEGFSYDSIIEFIQRTRCRVKLFDCKIITSYQKKIEI